MVRTYVKKICLLGDSAVGKTSLIRRFVTDEFEDKYIETIGSKTSTKKLSIVHQFQHVEITLLIWDVIGKKMYDTLHASHYKGASGALVVCDLTRKETFNNLQHWIRAFQIRCPDAVFIVLGNKSDLTGLAQIKDEELTDFATQYMTTSLKTSARFGRNVEQAFVEISRKMVEQESKGGLGRV